MFLQSNETSCRLHLRQLRFNKDSDHNCIATLWLVPVFVDSNYHNNRGRHWLGSFGIDDRSDGQEVQVWCWVFPLQLIYDSFWSVVYELAGGCDWSGNCHDSTGHFLLSQWADGLTFQADYTSNDFTITETVIPVHPWSSFWNERLAYDFGLWCG